MYFKGKGLLGIALTEHISSTSDTEYCDSIVMQSISKTSSIVV